MEPQPTQVQTQPQPTRAPIAPVSPVSRPLDTFGKIVFLIILLEAALMIGINMYENSRITTVSDSVAQKSKQLATNDYATINKQVDDVVAGQNKLQIVLANKLDWTLFYTNLNSITPKDTRITSISVSNTGAFKASGETASLTSLAKALVAWQSGVTGVTTPFSSVTLVNDGYSVTNGARKVTFSISGQVNLSKLGAQ